MSKTVKIVFVTNAITPYVKDLFIRLAQLSNVEFLVVIPDQTSAAVGEGVHQTNENFPFRVVRLKEQRTFFVSGSLKFKGLASLLWKEKPDVMFGLEIYFFPIFLNFPFFLFLKVLGIKMVMKSIPFRMPLYEDALAAASVPFESTFNVVQKIKRTLGNFKRKIQVRISALFYRSLDAHVNYIEEGFKIYGSYGVKKEQIHIIYNSPDSDKLLEMRKLAEQDAPILPLNPARIIHVGRLVEWKRVDLLIHAVELLQKKYPTVELLVIGYGPYEKQWKELSSSLGLNDRISFLGGVYDPLLLAKYHVASSVYVLAGMGGLSINEAMCFGLPVICSTGDGTEKQLVIEGETGFFFRDDDFKDLAAKIDQLLSDSDRRKKMGENSVKIIENKINIHLVVQGYRNAVEFVIGRKLTDV